MTSDGKTTKTKIINDFKLRSTTNSDRVQLLLIYASTHAIAERPRLDKP
jgi:hypothetical protein